MGCPIISFAVSVIVTEIHEIGETLDLRVQRVQA